MDNSINFKGAFLIKNSTTEIKNAIIPLLGKESKYKVFDNVVKDGDTFFVTNKNHDRDVADIILKTPNIIFKYFPTLTPKTSFVKGNISEAKNAIKQNSKTAISVKSKLLNAIRKPIDLRMLNIKCVQERNLKYLQKELFLNINDKEYTKTIDVQSGVCTIRKFIKDPITKKTKKRVILEITPPGKYGISFAKYTPISETENIRRIAVKNGEKILEYSGPVNETFDKNVALAKQHYLEQMIK